MVLQGGVRIEGRFRVFGKNGVGFALAPHDRTQPLVIDPALSYSTYFGAAGNDAGYSMTTDTNRNVYVAGLTTSQELPVSRTAAQPAFGRQASALNNGDTFVAKYTSAGALSFVTCLGSEPDQGIGFEQPFLQSGRCICDESESYGVGSDLFDLLRRAADAAGRG